MKHRMREHVLKAKLLLLLQKKCFYCFGFTPVHCILNEILTEVKVLTSSFSAFCLTHPGEQVWEDF